MSEQDDLTTDAIPSPPRDEVKSEKFEENQDPDHVNIPRTKTKTKHSKKNKKTPSTAFASVINISHANGIHVGSYYNINVNKPENRTPEKDYVVTEAIKTLFDSTEPVNRKHLIFLSQHINSEWRSMARGLDYSEGQIDQFNENFRAAGQKEVIIQLLLDWIQNEADDATIGRLSKILWDTSQQDAVTRWSKFSV